MTVSRRFRTLLVVTSLLVLAGSAFAQGPHPSPADWRDQNIYFIFTDRFFDGNPSNNTANNSELTYNLNGRWNHHGGDFKGIEKKLDYIQALGATTIWITPIVQNYGMSSWHGYGATDFYSLQPNWGTTNDLKALVNAIHERGMYVVLDVVINHMGDKVNPGGSAFNINGYTPSWKQGRMHSPPFNQLTNFHNNGSIQNYDDQTQVELGELSNLDDLRTETQYVRTNLIEIYKHWIEVGDFDGFRLDTVKHVNIGAWQYFNPQIRAYANSIGKTNFFQFGEVFHGDDTYVGRYTGTKAGGAFANDSVLDFPLYYKAISAFAQSGNTKQIEDHYNNIPGKYDSYSESRLITFVDNHDVARFMNTANNDTNKLHLALSWLYSSRGIPCLYYGTEQNFNGSGDPVNREDMFHGTYNWSGPAGGRDNFDMTERTFRLVAKLNNLRRLYPSLRRGTHINLWNSSGGPGLFAYGRNLNGEEILIAFNTASGNQTLGARPTPYPAGTVMVNLLDTNETVTTTSGSDRFPSITIPGGGFKMFIPKDRLLPLDPVVVAQSPIHEATNVAVTAPITLTFSKRMNTNATQGAFSITPSANGSFSWSADRTVMTFTPASELAGKTTIVVRVNSGATDDESGNHVYGAFETFFHSATGSSGPPADTTPPTAAIQQPANNAVLQDVFSASGTATDNVAVAAVEVRVDNGSWMTASGTNFWSLMIDSKFFSNGTHQIQARARDTSDNLSTTAQRSVTFSNATPPGASYDVLLNAGGAAPTTNCDNSVWLPDQQWQSGSFGYLGGTAGNIANTITGICAQAQTLYQNERYSSGGSLEYRFDVQDGTYEITLLQTETWSTGPNQRIFHLDIEDTRVLTNFDIFATTGGMNLPLSQTFTISVSDSQLNIVFTPVSDNARVSAIRVRRVDDLDSDGDGIPNWWTNGWFDHPTGEINDDSRATDDADGDGFSNLEEFIALTSPVDLNDFPVIYDIEGAPHPVMTMPTATGRMYDLQWKADLSTTDAWTTIIGNRVGSGEILPFPDTNAPPRGAYRIRIHRP